MAGAASQTRTLHAKSWPLFLVYSQWSRPELFSTFTPTAPLMPDNFRQRYPAATAEPITAFDRRRFHRANPKGIEAMSQRRPGS